jgi:cytidylate kinase
MPVITISRQVGCGRQQIVGRVCDFLEYSYFDKRLLIREATEAGLTEDEIVDFSEDNYKTKNLIQHLFMPGPRMVSRTPIRVRDETGIEKKLIRHLDESDCILMISRVIKSAHQRGNIVIVGRGAQVILKDQPDVLHVRLIAPMRVRVKRVQERENWTEKEAQQYIQERDQAIAEYMERFFRVAWDDPSLYHFTINTELCGLEGTADFIIDAVKRFEQVPAA